MDLEQEPAEKDLADLYSSEDEGTTDERKHNQLLDAISSLDGKKKHKHTQRTVISNQISEFNFSSSKDNKSKVKLHELVGSLKESGRHGDLKKQLKSVQKHSQTVSTPLPKHEKQKIDRTIVYEATTKDISKWDPIVHRNRNAEQLQFPLQKQDFRVVTTDQLVKRFQPRTPLEVQVAALLQGSENVIQNPKDELTPAEQRALEAMDLEEAKERRRELMKHRALLSYKEAKAKRQKKIKSKRYHRILKKEKLKNEKKLLETLQRDNPEEFLEKMKQYERDRAEERASLKHRGGSKYLKRQMIYAKFDDRARQEVQDMLQKSRELTQKLEAGSDDDSGDDEGFVSTGQTGGDTHYSTPGSRNPWMAKISAARPEKSMFSRPEEMKNEELEASDENAGDDHVDNDSNEDDEEVVVEASNHVFLDKDSVEEDKEEITENILKGDEEERDKKLDRCDQFDDIDQIFEKGSDICKKVRGRNLKKREKGKKKKGKKKNKSEPEVREKTGKSSCNAEQASDENIEDENSDNDNMISESLVRKRTLEDIENQTNEEALPHKMPPAKKHKTLSDIKDSRIDQKTEEKEAYIDPNKLFTKNTKIKQVGEGPVLVENGGSSDEVDAEEQQRMTIAQAFADDDVIEEFRQEKADVVEKDKPEDIDLTLPGWGSWGGEGIKVSKRKRKRFTIKAPPPLPRKDEQLGHVIISEKKNEAVKKHQVSSVPFPYLSAEQFEKSIRAPVGNTWNPETVYRQLVKPKVVTQLGHIITPIDKAETFKDMYKKKDDDDDDDSKDKKDSDSFKRTKLGNKKHKGKSKGKKK